MSLAPMENLSDIEGTIYIWLKCVFIHILSSTLTLRLRGSGLIVQTLQQQLSNVMLGFFSKPIFLKWAGFQKSREREGRAATTFFSK